MGISIEHLVLEIGRNFGQNAVYFIQRRAERTYLKLRLSHARTTWKSYDQLTGKMIRVIFTEVGHMILANNDGDCDADDYE